MCLKDVDWSAERKQQYYNAHPPHLWPIRFECVDWQWNTALQRERTAGLQCFHWMSVGTHLRLRLSQATWVASLFFFYLSLFALHHYCSCTICHSCKISHSSVKHKYVQMWFYSINLSLLKCSHCVCSLHLQTELSCTFYIIAFTSPVCRAIRSIRFCSICTNNYIFSKNYISLKQVISV